MNTPEDRPPVKLPNGKRNPAYWRWYRKTEDGRATTQKYQQSEKFKTAQARYRSKPDVKAKRNAKLREQHLFGTIKCEECGSVYDKLTVIERGWKTIGHWGCICDLCA